jgi:hypothetical protein
MSIRIRCCLANIQPLIIMRQQFVLAQLIQLACSLTEGVVTKNRTLHAIQQSCSDNFSILFAATSS